MSYNENINLFVTTDRNNADVFNAPLEKIIENIEDTRAYLNQLQTELDQLELRLVSEYTNTEQLNDILANGIKGDKGDPGEGLAYNWNGTALGVKLESEANFIYTDLKGDPGDVSTEQLEEVLTGYPTLEYLEETINEVKTELEEDLESYALKTELEEDLESYALKTEIPTSLPASDVYDWAKASTKPTYTASEVGALASNGTAVNASKVSNALTISLNGASQGAYNGSAVKNINITASSVGALANVGAGGVHELGQYLDLHKGGSTADYDARIYVDGYNQIVLSDAYGTLGVNSQINDLKSTVVNGKTSVANAINGKLGTTLSNQTSFSDMAYYINTIQMFSLDNLYVGGNYAPLPSGVGVTRVIFKIASNSRTSSSDSGYRSVEFTNNARNTYRISTVWTYHNGTRSVSTSSPTTINSTGTVTTSFRFPSVDTDVASIISIAVFDNPIYDVKSLTTGFGYDFICIP